MPPKKKCRTCLQDKALSSFHKCSSAKDGLNGACKECLKHKYAAAAENVRTRAEFYMEKSLAKREADLELDFKTLQMALASASDKIKYDLQLENDTLKRRVEVLEKQVAALLAL